MGLSHPTCLCDWLMGLCCISHRDRCDTPPVSVTDATYPTTAKMVALLLAAGAPANMKMSFYARSPAQCAAAAACGEALDLLLASGAAVRVRDKMKLTLLHDAARGGDVACVRAVLRGGGAADVEARDKWGRTPLTWCVLE